MIFIQARNPATTYKQGHSLVMIFIQARNPATTYKQRHSLVMIFIQARNPATTPKQGHSLVMILIQARNPATTYKQGHSLVMSSLEGENSTEKKTNAATSNQQSSSSVDQLHLFFWHSYFWDLWVELMYFPPAKTHEVVEYRLCLSNPLAFYLHSIFVIFALN
jgi:hypothetical protein